ncbi:MAG: TetR/AcrR family transcriptional regulator, partial [Gammaproteobacteria bacterium]|nr:TetR/AcrR family transcriptional regulator [Gammaproteobacteria bacterium]
RRMLSVAERMFVERGYAHTSLDAIVRRSGGSKATLLKYFRNKAGLLAAVFDRVAERRVADALSLARSGGPADALGAFGKAVLAFYLRHDSLVIYRSVMAEGYRHPALAQAFYYGGHARFVAALAARLQAWHDAGLLVSRDTHGDANRFLHMLRSNLLEPGVLGLAHTFSAGQIRREVEATVNLFLHGITRPLPDQPTPPRPHTSESHS